MSDEAAVSVETPASADETPPTDWRAMAAALANEDARTVYAQLVLGQEPELGGTQRAARRTERSIQTLSSAGLLDADGHVSGGVFRELLAAAAPPRAEGVDRFLADGRIVRYPSNPGERRALLERVAATVLQSDEVVDEAVINERLSAFHDDVAVLRRYLVDAGLVERTRSGTEYARVG